LTALRATGSQLGPERLDLCSQAVLLAEVVLDHVQDQSASPELPAVLKFMNDSWTVCREVAANHYEHAHAQPDQSSGQSVKGNDRNGEPGAKALD
jgi:hypothetical protein